MITISLCMIVKNEERTLARCLDSVAGIADEIIIVDTGSSDRTTDIAAQYTDQVYTYEWKEDFAAARNESFAKATQEYILWLDADDVLLPAERAKLEVLKQQLPSEGETAAVILNYTLAEGAGGESTCDGPTTSPGQAGCRVPLAWPAARAAQLPAGRGHYGRYCRHASPRSGTSFGAKRAHSAQMDRRRGRSPRSPAVLLCRRML